MDDIELVRSKVDIVELINSHIPLKKAGRNYKALCPFHSEKTPSFIVSPELQIYKCFSCGEAGNVFSFLQNYEGMTFGEALRSLAEKVGVKLKRYQASSEEKEKDKLMAVNHLSSEFYQYLLTKHQVGQKALRYLLQRGISKASIKNFNLGYAPDSWESLQRFLVRKKSYHPQDLLKTGLIIKGSRGWYDRFRGRVIFPQFDHRGNVLGFAGRTIDKDIKKAKYINSPETALYHKSDLLYGLYQARASVKKEKRCIVVEGELDVISSSQVGVKNIVAIKGSALTEGQINLIKRYVDSVALALDADVAGDQATRRGIAIADKAGLIVSVIDLGKSGKNKDPDDIAQSDPKLWRQISKTSQIIYDFFLQSSLKRHGFTSAVAKKRVTDELLPIWEEIDNEVIKAHFYKKLSQAIDTSEEVLYDQSQKLKKSSQTIPLVGAKTRDKKEKTQEEILSDYLLSLILQAHDPCVLAKDLTLDYIGISKYEKIFAFLQKACQKTGQDKLKVIQLLANIPEELKPTVNDAFLKDLHDLGKDQDKYGKEFAKTIKSLEMLKLKQAQSKLSQKIKEMEAKKADDEGLNQLREEFNTYTESLKKLNS